MNSKSDKIQTAKSSKVCQSRLKTTRVTLKQSLMGACTNIIYKLGVIGGIKRMPQILKTTTAHSYVIFGEVLPDLMIAKQRLAKIIWFTYREKLKIAEDINSDVGWGCMPRVGQMVLAQALLRHFLSKKQVMDQRLCLKIIQPFLDSTQESAGYSLSMILKYARWKFGLNPGDWFNIGQLSEVLRKIQDELPLQGSEDLKLVFFNQSVIFLNIIEEKCKIDKCQCSQKKMFCALCQKKQVESAQENSKQDKQQQKKKGSDICSDEYNVDANGSKQENQKIEEKGELMLTIQQYDSGQKVVQEKQEGQSLPIKEEHEQKWEIYDQNNINQEGYRQKTPQNSEIDDCKQKETRLKNSLLLIVSVRIAEKTIQKFDIQPILSLLSLRSSVGFIGGVPSKALYIVGYEGKELIYLDPHYVQQHVDKSNYLQHLHTFFCPQYRTISIQSLDPSMGFCFYLQTIEDIQKLLVRIEELKEVYEKNGRSFFISVLEKDSFDEDLLRPARISSDSPCQKSFEYNSLEFRDISDSF